MSSSQRYFSEVGQGIYIYIPLLEKRIFEITDLEKKVLESAMATKGDK